MGKYLTQRQAWQEIADAYKSEDHYGVVRVRERSVVGICAAVIALYDFDVISPRILTLMEGKLESYGKKMRKLGLYYWPISPIGNSNRRKFCLRMVKSCGKKNKTISSK